MLYLVMDRLTKYTAFQTQNLSLENGKSLDLKTKQKLFKKRCCVQHCVLFVLFQEGGRFIRVVREVRGGVKGGERGR